MQNDFELIEKLLKPYNEEPSCTLRQHSTFLKTLRGNSKRPLFSTCNMIKFLRNSKWFFVDAENKRDIIKGGGLCDYAIDFNGIIQ